MKKFKNILGCALALLLLAGLMVPLASVPAQASDYTLTVLNPLGTLVPRQNLPLADRQPLIDKLEAGGADGPVRLMVLSYDKNLDQHQTWALSIVLKQELERLYPGTTVELTTSDPPGGPVTWGVVPPAWNWADRGSVPRLGSPWGPKTGYGHIDGMPLFEEPFQRYQHWASYDVVVFGEQN